MDEAWCNRKVACARRRSPSSSIAGFTSREEYSVVSCSSVDPLLVATFFVPGKIVRLIDCYMVSKAPVGRAGVANGQDPPSCFELMEYDARSFGLDRIYRSAIREASAKFHHALCESNLPQLFIPLFTDDVIVLGFVGQTTSDAFSSARVGVINNLVLDSLVGRP